jgi:DNA polymerase-3 subunit delta
MPSLSLDRFLARLEQSKPISAVLLVGSDIYLRDLCRAKLVEACVPETAREWGLARFSAAETPLQRILQHARTRPMLASRQVIFVDEVEALERLGENAREAAVSMLAAYLGDPAPFTTLVLEADELDQRMKLFKLASELALVVEVELGRGDEAEMTLRMAREFGVEIERDAAEQLAESLNGELGRVRMELEKLATYVGESKRITAADVTALVVAAKKYSVWELAEMLAERDGDRALIFLDSLLREGEEPAKIVGAMAWMYRKLIEAQELPEHLSGWKAARQLQVRVAATAELALRQARKIPRQQLLAGLVALYEADNRLKSGIRNPREVMEFLIARLIAPA